MRLRGITVPVEASKEEGIKLVAIALGSVASCIVGIFLIKGLASMLVGGVRFFASVIASTLEALRALKIPLRAVLE